MESLTAPPSLRFAWPPAPRAGRVLAFALAISLAVHLAFTLWPMALPDDPEDVPLTATITELPPPPRPVAQPAPPPTPKAAQPKPKATSSPAAAPQAARADAAPAAVDS